MRLWRCLQIMASFGEILEGPRGQVGFIYPRPIGIVSLYVYSPAVWLAGLGNCTVCIDLPATYVAHLSAVQRDGHHWTIGPESYVDQHARLRIRKCDSQHNMFERHGPHPIAARPRSISACDAVSERFEQRGEEPIELVAKPASPLVDDLVEQSLVVEHDRPVQANNVQVLEGNRCQMMRDEPVERFQRWRDCSLIPNPVEIH